MIKPNISDYYHKPFTLERCPGYSLYAYVKDCDGQYVTFKVPIYVGKIICDTLNEELEKEMNDKKTAVKRNKKETL